MARVVAHLDLDAFFAAVEVLERPELAGLPVVVGGDPRGRGVVATASYEARAFGIRSAMSAAEAYRRCPEAVFVSPEHGRYRKHSQRVWALVREHAPVVEQVGIDEGYLDLGGVVGTVGEARAWLAELQQRIRRETGLSASFGCGSSKVIAKVASDLRKPAGITVVPAGSEADFLAPMPLRAIPGIGPKAEARLKAAGLAVVGDLAALPDDQLRGVMSGVVGRELRDRARGIDTRLVDPEPSEAVSIGREETFDRDVGEREAIADEVRRMAREVAERLARRERTCRTVTVKLRYPDFSILSRSQAAASPVQDGEDVERLALAALERALTHRPPPIRLVGVSVSRLAEGRQLVLPLDL